MKKAPLLLLFLTFSSYSKDLYCIFPNTTEDFLLKDCAVKEKNHLKVKPTAFAKIKFDKDGLAGGSFETGDCYWLRKSGVMKQTHCFDNGADHFKEELVRYKSDANLFGFMDKKLKVVIPAKYTFAYPFSGGKAEICMGCQELKIPRSEHKVMVGGTKFFIDKKGKQVK